MDLVLEVNNYGFWVVHCCWRLEDKCPSQPDDARGQKQDATHVFHPNQRGCTMELSVWAKIVRSRLSCIFFFVPFYYHSHSFTGLLVSFAVSHSFNIILNLHMCVYITQNLILLMDSDLHWSNKKRYTLKFSVSFHCIVLLQFPTYSGGCDCFAAAAHCSCRILPPPSSNPKPRPGNLLDIFLPELQVLLRHRAAADPGRRRRCVHFLSD